MRVRTRLLLAGGAVALVVLGLCDPALADSHGDGAGTRVIVSPEPGSRTASPSTQISFLGVAASHLGTVTVTGSVSGPHPGVVRAYSTGDGGSFLPARPFDPGETVTVHTGLDIVDARGGSFSFVVATPVAVHGDGAIPRQYDNVPGVEHFLSAPGVTPPKLTVTGATGALRGDDLVLSPKGDVGGFGPMITTPTGRLVYFDKLLGTDAMDVKVQQYLGKPVLTWWQGKVLDGHGIGEDVIANTAYRTIATVQAGNGYRADLHEFTITAKGTAFITAYDAIRWNLTSRGGRADGTAWDSLFEEVDVRTGLVMYEWHSLDHVPVAASYFDAPRGENAPFDWFHLNAIEQVGGGKLLLSGRNTSAIYEISMPQGGRVLWSLGGRDSSFRLDAGVSFHRQHDARLRAGDTVTMFDNEIPPTDAEVLFVKLDFKTMTARLEHSWSHDPPVTTTALGDVEPLPGGDTFVSWGTAQEVSLVGPSGTQLLTGSLPGNDDSYRTYAVDWHATPGYPPSLYAHSAGPRTVLAMSWNGATEVASWRVLAGARASALAPVRTVTDKSFETIVRIARAADVAVQALGANGRVLATSATVVPSA